MTINVSKMLRVACSIASLIAGNLLYQGLRDMLGAGGSLSDALERSYFQTLAILCYAYLFDR